MNKIHHTIELFLKKYQLDKPEKVYLCAFSGGYDSMCLLNSLKIVAPQNKIIAILHKFACVLHNQHTDAVFDVERF